jgi:O-antigen/teichoic acid export membrane protein
VTDETARSAREADEATRGSVIKVGAEVLSRLLGLATTLLLLWGLGASDFGLFVELSVYALLLAELGELGLQALASRALVAGTHSLVSLVRARLALAGLVAAVAVAAVPLAPPRGPGGSGRARGRRALALLILWFALSGWAEFLRVASGAGARGASRPCCSSSCAARRWRSWPCPSRAGAGHGASLAALAVSPLPGDRLAAPHAPPVRPGNVRGGPVLRESAPLAVHGGLLLLSPRVEFLVLSWLLPDREAVDLFYAALNVVWFLSMAPSAVAAGAMPALTREALRGGAAVRRRTAGTLALVAAPAAVGLTLVAHPVSDLLLRAGYAPADYTATAFSLRILSAALPALFLNALVFASLIASGHPSWLPRLTAARVAMAFALAFGLVPALGPRGAALGFVLAEWLLLLLGWIACRSVAFEVRVARPVGWALVACVPMSLAVSGVRESLAIALAIGALTWAATLALVVRLRPGLARELVGGLRYP